mmetsp:Transcript_10522/g.37072  ORF Transcript_10522/g.37072 Transcript_10522/m.37072 type:complete len:285 (+) Transcript_10522:413-1267(+)
MPGKRSGKCRRTPVIKPADALAPRARPQLLEAGPAVDLADRLGDVKGHEHDTPRRCERRRHNRLGDHGQVCRRRRRVEPRDRGSVARRVAEAREWAEAERRRKAGVEAREATFFEEAGSGLQRGKAIAILHGDGRVDGHHQRDLQKHGGRAGEAADGTVLRRRFGSGQRRPAFRRAFVPRRSGHRHEATGMRRVGRAAARRTTVRCFSGGAEKGPAEAAPGLGCLCACACGELRCSGSGERRCRDPRFKPPAARPLPHSAPPRPRGALPAAAGLDSGLPVSSCK